MKISFTSDCHNELAPLCPQASKAEVMVLAGDIDNGTKGAEWAIEHFVGIPKIYVAGNHEFYDGNKDHVTAGLKSISTSISNFHFLENESVVIGDVRFIGCTLWPAMDMLGPHYFERACLSASTGICEKIEVSVNGNGDSRKLQVDDIIRYSRQSVDFLEKELIKDFNGKTVVISHYAPSIRSVPVHKRNSVKATKEGCNLEWLIHKYTSVIDVWIHGHTHQNIDYCIGNTRIITNQRGYHPRKLLCDFGSDAILDIHNVHESPNYA